MLLYQPLGRSIVGSLRCDVYPYRGNFTLRGSPHFESFAILVLSRVGLKCGNYADIKQYLIELDIAYARTLGGDNDSFLLPQDFHAWMPTAHHDNPKIMVYIDKFLNLDISEKVYHGTRVPRLLYIWGHSYEFDEKNNWDHIEKICEKIAHNNEIWYATNIEIYDYVQAYKSLRYSADGHKIYNPTLLTIWIDAGSKLYSIQPGETICIDF